MASTTFLFLDSANASEIRDKKWVENQMSPNYNDGKYKGSLEKYFYGTERTPRKLLLTRMDGAIIPPFASRFQIVLL